MPELTPKQLNQVQKHIDNNALSSQFSTGPIQVHEHNGVDASPLDLQYCSSYGMSKNAFFLAEVANGNSGTSKTINWNLGNKQTITTTGSCTLSFINPMGACNLILRIVHNNTANAYTYSWPSNAQRGEVKWPGGVTPGTTNTSNAVDIISFYFDGNLTAPTYWGSYIFNFS